MSDTVDTILQSAMMLFAEKGFSATTTRQIAQRAGVNEVTLFRHFRSKTELFHKILEEIRRLYPPLLEKQQSGETDPDQIVREFCLVTLRRIREAPHLVRLMLYAMLDGVDDLREHLIEKRVAIYLDLLTGAFEQLRREGRCVPGGDPAEVARLLISQVFGLGIMKLCQLRAFDEIDEERLADQVSEQFIREAVTGRNSGLPPAANG